MSEDMDWYSRRMQAVHREVDAAQKLIVAVRQLLKDAAPSESERLRPIAELLADYDERRASREEQT